MKTRTGFVSNSSSSSFVIISKGELNEEKLRQRLDYIADSFSKYYFFEKDLFFEYILSRIKKIETVSADPAGWGFQIPVCEFNKDIHLYLGGHEDNNNDSIDLALSSTDLNIDTIDMRIIWKPRDGS